MHVLILFKSAWKKLCVTFLLRILAHNYYLHTSRCTHPTFTRVLTRPLNLHLFSIPPTAKTALHKHSADFGTRKWCTMPLSALRIIPHTASQSHPARPPSLRLACGRAGEWRTCRPASCGWARAGRSAIHQPASAAGGPGERRRAGLYAIRTALTPPSLNRLRHQIARSPTQS